MSVPARQRGQLRVVVCSDCEKKDRKLEAAIKDLENAEIALRSERSKAKRYKALWEDKQKVHPDFTTVERLFNMWCDESGRTRSALDSKRIQVGLNALKKFTPRELACAIRGGCRNGFIDPKSKVAYNQFGRLLANADSIELNIERYERWCEQHNVAFDRGPSLAELKAAEKAKAR